jgi:ribulose-phosphate 3-epimerase
MHRPEKISASILSADFTRLGEQIHTAEKYGTDWIHIDVMDGHYVPNITMGPFIVEAARRATELPLDIHLMIERPEKFLKEFAQAGAYNITIHAEASPNLFRSLETIHDLGCRATVAINPGTPASAVRPVLPLVDMVMVMTVNPGYSGQKFIQTTLDKVRQVRSWIDLNNLNVDIQVDGGIDAETLPLAQAAGANVYAIASAIYKHPEGIATGLRILRNLLIA